VRLQLHTLAYNLGNFMHTLAMPKTVETWSMTSLREKLIKIGEGRQPWALRHVSDGRGRGAAADIRRNSVADRPAAGTACASISGAEAENDKRQRESCVRMKAKPPTLTLAG